MPFRNTSLAEIYEDLGRSIEAESAIAAYQTREGIPSTIDTPAWMRPPPTDEATANSARAFQKIVEDTRQARFTELIQDRNRSVDLLFEEIQRPGYDAQRLYTELIRRRQNHLDDIRETNARTNPTPPQRPPTTTDRRPPPTSLDNAPSLRTAQTSGARAPITATAPPRPAQPSHWNTYQPPGSTPPPTTRAIPRTMDQPPPGLPQAAARGRITSNAAGAGIALGLRLASGEDIGQAAYGAAGGLAGGLAGEGLGEAIGAGLGLALGGPPGAAVGGMLGGLIGQIGGGYAGGSLADRYYPGNNGPLPGTFPIGQIEAVPLPHPIAPQLLIPGPARTFDPTRPGDRRPRLGNIPDPSDPVSGFGPYYVQWDFQTGGEAQHENPLQISSGAEVHGPITFSQRFDAAQVWIVNLTHFGSTTQSRRNTPISEPIAYNGWNDRPPHNFTVQNLSLPESPPQPFNPSHAWPPTPENAPRPNPNNTPNDQYQPNPLPQTTPSPTGQPTGEPLPGNIGGNEPELQPQRSPDQAGRPTPGDRAYPHGASPGGGAGSGGGNSGFPVVPVAALVAAAALPAVIRARLRVTAQRPTPTTQPRGSGTANPPPPPATPEEPCRGNRCSQRQLQGIDDANLRLLRLEQGLLGGADVGANAAILAKLDVINAKLGAQIPGGGIATFIKKLWDSQMVAKVLNILTFVTVLHNAYMLSNNITQTLFSAFDSILEFFAPDLKNAEGGDFSTSQWVSNAVEGFFNNIFGTETVNGIQANWKKFNRIYQAGSNIISSFQSMMYSMLESMETIGNYVAQIGNAAKKFGVFADNCYRWMNPNNNFTQNRYFNALNNVQEAVENIDEVAGEALSIQQTGAELFNQKEALTKAVEEVIPGDTDGRRSNTTDTPGHKPSTDFETKLVQESQRVLIPIPDSAEVRPEIDND